MKISAQGKNAVKIMIDLAKNSDSIISISELSDRHKITPKYLEKIIASLVKANLLSSFRGQNGGYQLAKSPENTTLKEIFDVTGDSPKLTKCTTTNCERQGYCETSGCWVALTNIINDFLCSVSLQDIIDKTISHI